MMLTRWWVLNFLWILPLTVLALTIQYRQKKKSMEQFADADLLERLTDGDHRGRRFIKAILLIFSLGLMFFALTGPRWGSSYQEVSQKGVDIMILVDVSPSMLVEDIKPNRLERARREIVDFLKVVEGDRVGLVAFSGAAFIQCPLTLDYAALQLFLNALEPGLIPVSGTDLGAAVDTGISAFDFESETDKVILLITDGEDNERRGLEAAGRAEEKDVRIFVFGIGELSGGPIPAGEGQGGFKKDKAGKLILSKLNEVELEAIAAGTGGRYVRSVAGDLDLDLLYFEGIKSTTQAKTLKSGKIKIQDERFSVFVLAAFLLLLLEGVIDEKMKTALSLSLAIWIVLFIFNNAPAGVNSVFAAEDPDRLYQKGRFAEAEKTYARYDMDNPKDIRYRYNRGCSAYQNGDYKGATAAFSSVLRRAEADQVRFKAAYNLGNTAYQSEDFDSAVAYFKQAVIYDPSNADARHNLELALRAQENRKKEKAEKSETDGQKDASDNYSQDPGSKTDPASSSEKHNKHDSGPKQGHTDPSTGDKKGTRTEENQKARQKSPEDLTGDLKPLQDLPAEGQRGDLGNESRASADKRRAEALLDNIKEDPSRLMRYLIPDEKRHGISSGRDW